MINRIHDQSPIKLPTTPKINATVVLAGSHEAFVPHTQRQEVSVPSIVSDEGARSFLGGVQFCEDTSRCLVNDSQGCVELVAGVRRESVSQFRLEVF